MQTNALPNFPNMELSMLELQQAIMATSPLREETSEQYQLSEVTLPLIGRSSHAHGIYFTAQDWEKNKIAGKRARLISFPEIPYDEYPAKHKEYISLGEANGEHRGLQMLHPGKMVHCSFCMGSRCSFS